MKRHILFYSPSMEALAREIVRLHGDDIELGRVDCQKFPDRSPNTRVWHAKELRKRSIAFLLSFENWGDYFEQLSVHYHLSDRAKAYRVIMPYGPTFTQERSNTEDVVITAETLLRSLSPIAPNGPGLVPVFVYDLHALAVTSFARPNIRVVGKTGLRLLFQALEQEPEGTADLTIVYPDAGAKSRFEDMEAVMEAQARIGFTVAVCGKQRIGETGRKVYLQSGDVRGRRTVIVDDLVRTFGTQIVCAGVLLEAGAATVDAYATHVSHPDMGWQKFNGEGGIRRVYMTDSCPATVEVVRGNPNVQVFSLANSIAKEICE